MRQRTAFNTPLQQVRQKQSAVKKGKKARPKKTASKPNNDPLGETVDEEGMDDSGLASTQGESIYEELDNPERYEDMSDFDEPHFYD